MKPRPQKLLDQVREAIRLKHYSYRAEESYVYWVRRHTLFYDKRHPKGMSSSEIEALLIKQSARPGGFPGAGKLG